MAKLVSKIYGDALFEVALEKDQLDHFLEAIEVVKKLLQENVSFGQLLNHPKVAKEEKVHIIEEAFGTYLPEEVVGMFVLLVEKGHATEIDSVLAYFIDRVKEEKKIGCVFVTTAIELNDAKKKTVEDRILETTSYESLEMYYEVDESLIGGMVIRIGNRVMDSSIKTKLYELTRNLRTVQI